MPRLKEIFTVKALSDKYKIINYHISDPGVQVVVCIGPTFPSHFSKCVCILAKDIPVILHHECPVLEVPPEVPLVLRVSTVLPASDVANVEYVLRSHHSLLLFILILKIMFPSYCVHICL